MIDLLPAVENAFRAKEKAYIDGVEPEILQRFEEIKQSDNYTADRAILRNYYLLQYRIFLRGFCGEFRREFREKYEVGYRYAFPSKMNVLDKSDRNELADHYREYLEKLLTK